MSGNREYRWGIQTKLSLASGLLVLISLASFGLLSYFVTRRTLDRQMGDLLISQARMATATLRYEADLGILSVTPAPGGSAYTRLHEKLASAKATANLDNMILLDANDFVIADANSEVPVGEKYLIAESDKIELQSVWAGKPVASLLYPGRDGRSYKAAYAPVMNAEHKVVAVLRVEASAGFLQTINSMGVILFISAFVIAAIAALLGMLIARSIVMPVRKLVLASQRIATGDLDTRVVINSRDEIGFFGRTFNQMARNLKKLYEEVEQRGRQIAELSASVAHEVRSPISAIQGFTELLEDEMDEDAPGREYTADIKNEIRILNSKITDFINFAKPMQIDPMPVDVTEVIDSALVSLEKEISNGDISVVANIGSEFPAIAGDFDQLRSLFVNLFRNSIQSMEDGGTLIINVTRDLEDELGTSVETDSLKIEIQDTGCGMPPEFVERAFEPFFTTKGDGTGLGLPIVKKIVQVHNGRIELESSVDQGTTVRVFLPIDKEV